MSTLVRTKLDVRFSCKYVHALSSEEYRQCLRLNFRATGGIMHSLLRRERVRPRDRRAQTYAQVIMAHEKTTHHLLGWCLLTKSPHAAVTTSVYVRASARRRGLGTALMLKALTLYPRASVCPHDERSRAFFSSLDKRPRCANGYSF